MDEFDGVEEGAGGATWDGPASEKATALGGGTVPDSMGSGGA